MDQFWEFLFDLFKHSSVKLLFFHPQMLIETRNIFYISFLNVYYVTIHRLYEKYWILNWIVNFTSMLFNNDYMCNGLFNIDLPTKHLDFYITTFMYFIFSFCMIGLKLFAILNKETLVMWLKFSTHSHHQLCQKKLIKN